jgi:predicted transcriptional regulator
MASANIQERKLELIQWLSLVDDDSLIDKVAKVREESVSDWWNEISEAERESIKKGIRDADSGSLKPHAEARAKYEKWL